MHCAPTVLLVCTHGGLLLCRGHAEWQGTAANSRQTTRIGRLRLCSSSFLPVPFHTKTAPPHHSFHISQRGSSLIPYRSATDVHIRSNVADQIQFIVVYYSRARKQLVVAAKQVSDRRRCHIATEIPVARLQPEFQASLRLKASLATAAQWSWATRILFRFCLIYFGVYILVTQMLTTLLIIPKVDFGQLDYCGPSGRSSLTQQRTFSMSITHW